MEAIAFLLILLFTYTAINKLRNPDPLIQALTKSPYLGNAPFFFAAAIPVAEILVSLLLFFPLTRLAGLIGSFILLSLFTGYIILMLIFVKELPCSCGGIIQQLSWKQHLFFNLSFLTMTVLSIIHYKRRRLRNPVAF